MSKNSACIHCATGTQLLVKNLSTCEIVMQMMIAKRYLSDFGDQRLIKNCVIMGSGESMTNYNSTKQFIKILMEPEGIHMGKKSITLSTIGVPDKIVQFSDEIGVHLALSLHAGTNEKRNKLIRNLSLDQKGNTLVLFNFVEKHGKPLFDMIQDKADENRKVFFVSGNVATSDREAIRGIVEKQKNAIIVASLGTFSTGINIRNLHNIIFASPSKSQIRVLQSIGRGLRKSDNNVATTLYDVIDNISTDNKKNFAWLHGLERLRIYEKEKFKTKTYKVSL